MPAGRAFAPVADGMRRPGLFDAAIEPSADDVVSQFIAFTGRTPSTAERQRYKAAYQS